MNPTLVEFLAVQRVEDRLADARRARRLRRVSRKQR